MTEQNMRADAQIAVIDDAHAHEVSSGRRFEFGANWARFLELVDDDRIATAEGAIQRMLRQPRLDGCSFLDIGSGSGLSSLAARRLGARVHSFDYDPQSVATTAELRRRYFANDPEWTVESGSVLDPGYLRGLGRYDVVYSWGVLHHTGRMWEALGNVVDLVAPEGRLFVAIYNDTGSQARRWRAIKKTYNHLPRPLRTPFAALVSVPEEAKAVVRSILARRPFDYLRLWTDKRGYRGMSRWHDIVDWVGGYPYEFATPDEIFEFFRTRGFVLENLHVGGVGLGCNEFLFKRVVAPVPPA
jgi:2-polyprenyl-6-hydroxyphenyl methylase/3-demethylubiquinone-9 3-methyltransferase